MWAFKSLWDKGLVYEGFRVLAYCWRCETPLSNTETRMDDVYRDRQDPALTVGFELVDGPWAGDAGAGLDDHAVDAAGQPGPRRRSRHRLRRGRARRSAVRPRRRPPGGVRRRARRDGEPPVPWRRCRAPTSSALATAPLFDFFTDVDASAPSAPSRSSAPTSCRPRTAPASSTWRPASARTTRWPATPSASRRSCRWTSTGATRPRSPPWVGEHVFEANPLVIRHLKDAGVVVRHETYDHSYPHCWRCAQPLVYRAISSWFVEVTKFRDRMVELNEQITWVPEHLKHGSFGKWLQNARDWSISRNRFWGSPIPVWRSDDPNYPRVDVYGSLAELEADFGVARHRPPPPVRRRPGAAQPRRPDRALDDAARPRGARLLVRVGVDAVRPGALPVRERRVVRVPLPGRLHRRVHGPDPRLVLHAARAGHGAVRPPGVPDLREPRHRARRRRAEDVEEPAQLPGPDGGVRRLRRRRHALVPAVVADPARQRLLGHRRRPARHGPPGAAAAVERVVLPRPVRQRRRAPGHRSRARRRVDQRARPLRAGQDPPARRRDDADDGRLRPVRRLRRACGRSSTPSRTGTSAAAASASGTATSTPSTRCTPCSTWSPGRRPAAAVRRRGDPRRAACRSSGGQRAPQRLARSPSCRPTTSWSRRWTRCATCARPRCRCARPTAGGCASRWPR